MKVSSPIGDLPFKPTNIKLKDGAIHMEGKMGAWPAHVQINMSDIRDIAYLIRYPLFAVLAILITIITLLLIGY
jgi:hypothetical protein